MKVVHVIDSGGYYGAEVMLVHLCNAQKKLGLDVEVISIGTKGNYEKPLESKMRENAITCTPWRMMALPDFHQALKIISYCREAGSHVIHSHGYKGNILLGMIPKFLRKIPVVTTVHGYTEQNDMTKLALYQALDKWVLKKLDRTILVSNGMTHQVENCKLGNKLQVIPNGIPITIPDGANEPLSLFSSDYFNVAAIGRLSAEKNFQLLIRAIKIVSETVTSSRLIIYGEGDQRSELERLVSSLKLEDKVFLPGYIAEPSRLYRHADLFVNSSLTEGMPISILEAMREGCPMVCTDIPATRSLLQTANGGHLLSALDELSMAEAILNMHSKITNKELNVSALTDAFKRNFTAEKMAQGYMKIYQDL